MCIRDSHRDRRVAATNAITYYQGMNPLLMKIFGQVVRRAATDTVARRHIVVAAKKVVEEGREIGGSEDPAYAAGKAMRRTLDKLRRRDG